MTPALARAGIVAADFILKDVFGLSPLAKMSPLTASGFDAFVLDALDALKKTADPVEHAALKAMVSGLQRQWPGLTVAQQTKAIDDAAKTYLGVARDVGTHVNPVLKDKAQEIVVATKMATAQKFNLHIQPTFDTVDEGAMHFAALSQGNFIRTAQGVRVVQLSQVARDVVAKGIENGLDYHDIGTRLGDALNQTDAARSEAYWKLIASVFVARARTYSTLRSFDEAGISSYQFESVLDQRTSHMCRFLHGRVFPVAGALAKFAEAESLEDPEDIKAVTPWPSVGKTSNGDMALYVKQGDSRKIIAQVEESGLGKKDVTGKFSHELSNGELSDLGVSQPPLHGHCRSTLVPIFGAAPPPNPEPAPAPPRAGPVPRVVAPEPTAAVTPEKLPDNIAELVRPLPSSFEDFETPGKFSPEHAAAQAASAKLQGAIDKLNTLPPALDWSTMYVKAPIKGTPLNDAGDITVVPKVTGPHVTNALKAPSQAVPIGKLAMLGDPDSPIVDKKIVAEHINGAAAFDKKIVVIKFQDNYYLHQTPASVKAGFTGPFLSPPQVSILATKADALGHTTINAHVIDGDGIAAKPPKVPKPKAIVAIPAPLTAAPLPSVPTPLPQVHAAASGETILHQQDGAARGSNNGGFYTGSDGVKRYVKFYGDPKSNGQPGDPSQAYCEHLANSIYRDLGHEAPESQAFVNPKTGKLAYASKLFEGGKTLQQVGLDEDKAKKFMKGFVGDVLTGNWDAVGTGFDNAMVLPGGRIARIDNGGSFIFRAKEGRKPDSVLNQISDWEVLFSDKNRYYKEVANKAGFQRAEDMADDVRSGVAAVRELRDKHGGWQAYVDKHVGSMDAADKKKVVSMLEARTNLLTERVAEFDRPKPKPVSATQFSAVIPHSSLAAQDLPVHPFLAQTKKATDEAMDKGVMPITGEVIGPRSGSLPNSYNGRALKELEKSSTKGIAGIKAFTNGDYRSIRASEFAGKPNRDSDNLHDAYKTVNGDVGRICFRGINLDKTDGEAVVAMHLKTSEWGLMRGKSASSSSSWDLNVACRGMFGNVSFKGDNAASGNAYSGGYSVIYKIKNKSGIAVEPKTSTSGENEILFPRDARFRTTGLSWAQGSKQKVLIVEAEEI